MPSEKRARQRVQRKKRQRKQGFLNQLVGLRRRATTIITIAVALVALYFLFTIITGGQESASTQLYAQDVACGATRPELPADVTFDEPSDMRLDPSTTITATLRTSCGPITVLIDQTGAPETANSFVFLAERGFYNGTVFHRIIRDFMVQGGDPTASGQGGPGYRIPDEYPPAGFVYEPGVVAMANAGRGRTGSQFFIVTGARGESLNQAFNVLGRVIDGLDTVERIAEVDVVPDARGEASRPLESVYVERVEISISS